MARMKRFSLFRGFYDQHAHPPSLIPDPLFRHACVCARAEGDTDIRMRRLVRWYTHTQAVTGRDSERQRVCKARSRWRHEVWKARVGGERGEGNPEGRGREVNAVHMPWQPSSMSPAEHSSSRDPGVCADCASVL